jgi:endo-1,4-beta-xylanase
VTLQDTILLIERLEKFNRPVQLTEVGASSGPTQRFHCDRKTWLTRRTLHLAWALDTGTQADWMEGLYTLAYSKPWIEAVNWYDFVDPHAWIKQGGLIESPKGEKKLVYERLLKMQERVAEFIIVSSRTRFGIFLY